MPRAKVPDADRQRAAAILGSISTPAKAAAARRNGKLGGRPPRRKGLTQKPNAR
jgi:hypothetical protein